VVTHGLVCRSLAARHLTLPPGEVVPERWENTAVTIVDRPENGSRWPVRLLNCAAHLDDLGARPVPGSGVV
jgi:broad specificity phosphatase PhoE